MHWPSYGEQPERTLAHRKAPICLCRQLNTTFRTGSNRLAEKNGSSARQHVRTPRQTTGDGECQCAAQNVCEPHQAMYKQGDVPGALCCAVRLVMANGWVLLQSFQVDRRQRPGGNVEGGPRNMGGNLTTRMGSTLSCSCKPSLLERPSAIQHLRQYRRFRVREARNLALK